MKRILINKGKRQEYWHWKFEKRKKLKSNKWLIEKKINRILKKMYSKENNLMLGNNHRQNYHIPRQPSPFELYWNEGVSKDFHAP